jgi:hypothetical protein
VAKSIDFSVDKYTIPPIVNENEPCDGVPIEELEEYFKKYRRVTPSTLIEDAQKECAQRALEESMNPLPTDPMSFLGNKIVGQE